MNWYEQCAVVIPCLNEERTIGALARQARRHVKRVYVVNDGSTDGTAREARRSGAEVLEHETSRGKGRSLETGLTRAYADGFKWALCMDGDGQHDPSEIPAFLQAAEGESPNLIIGNRIGRENSMPWVRRIVNAWMSARLSKLCGVELPDSQCGFRMLELESWSRLTLQAASFEIESEMLLQSLRAHHRIVFVPIQTLYGRERSKIRPARDSARWLRWYFRARKELKKPRLSPALAHDLSN